MVSNVQRYTYVSEEASSSGAESTEDVYNSRRKRIRSDSINHISDEENDEIRKSFLSTRKSQRGRKVRCFSKNALMARENRLKKKIYVTNLENEIAVLRKSNKKLNTVLEGQSHLIADMKKEVKYLKSVLSNSSDIRRLIRNIHQSTGMSVKTSLDNKLSLNNCISKPSLPIARKTAHPWEDQLEDSNLPSEVLFPPQMSDDFSSTLSNDMLMDNGLEGFNFDLSQDFDVILNDPCTINSNYVVPSEHDYTRLNPVQRLDSEDDDVGVCLHVSKHRVSLEFCNKCNEKACENWSEQ